MIFRRSNPGEDLLIEMATTAHRERDATGRIEPSPAWADLSPAGRETLFERQMESRLLESLLDPAGLDATGRVLVWRIGRIGQIRS